MNKIEQQVQTSGETAQEVLEHAYRSLLGLEKLASPATLAREQEGDEAYNSYFQAMEN